MLYKLTLTQIELYLCTHLQRTTERNDSVYIFIIIMCAHATAHAWRPEDSYLKLVLSFHVCVAVARILIDISKTSEPDVHGGTCL